MSDKPNFVENTIDLTLEASKTVVNDTIKITVPINAVASRQNSEEELRLNIKKALQKLIPNAKEKDWQFGDMQRSQDNAGMERVSLHASVRVSENENYRLEERARDASVEGLKLNTPIVDISVPNWKIEETEVELRQQILRKAMKEIETIHSICSVKYRIASIYYGGSDIGNKSPYTASNMVAMMAPSPSGGGSFDTEISNSQRVTLRANVKLSSILVLENTAGEESYVAKSI